MRRQWLCGTRVVCSAVPSPRVRPSTADLLNCRKRRARLTTRADPGGRPRTRVQAGLIACLSQTGHTRRTAPGRAGCPQGTACRKSLIAGWQAPHPTRRPAALGRGPAKAGTRLQQPPAPAAAVVVRSGGSDKRRGCDGDWREHKATPRSRANFHGAWARRGHDSEGIAGTKSRETARNSRVSAETKNKNNESNEFRE